MVICRSYVSLQPPNAAHCPWIEARRLLLVVILGLAAQWVAPASAAAVDVSIRRDGDAVLIEASATLKADTATAWDVLTDYDRYADFIPGLRASRVTARTGAVVTVEQSGDATVWLFRMPLDVTYEIAEFPPYRLRSRATASVLRTLDSTYVLTPTAAGVRLAYAGRLAPRRALLGRIERFAAQQSVVRDFQALADEIERRSATQR